jgi:Kdo2-lipid IVA lauroyltransferase/acyltransferase
MRSAGFYLFYSLNWLITLLPLRILYLFSDFLYLILYYFPSYRRKVVRTNLKNAFPEKSEAEIITIEKKFYRHLSDVFVEVMKMMHISEKELRERFVINNLDLLERLHKNKRDIVAVMAHYNNWEWLTILPPQTSYRSISIYKPLHNRHFDDLINSWRARFGMVLTPMQSIVRELIEDRKKGINTLSAFINDQIPPKNDIKYWTHFLNQDTAIYLGAEKIASRYDMAMVYFHVRKIRRGYYHLNIDLLFENTAGLPENLITETHVRYLENIIREEPQYWVWSHRRWKHKKTTGDD